jgi:isocitrate lyase
MFIDSSTLFVNEKAFGGLHQIWFAVLVVEITVEIMWVEVEFFDTERSRNFPSRVHFRFSEHHTLLLVFENSASFRV